MKKKGFVFIETIITIVFLAAALLVLYSSYRNAITEEKSKVYYDDISYLYRNYYLADFLINKTEISKVKDTAFQNKYVIKVSDIEEDLYSGYQKNEGYPEELETIKEEFNVSEMVIVSEEVISKCYNESENENCKNSYEGLNDGLTRYIETMNLEEDEDEQEGRNRYYLVTEYRERATDDGVEACGENEEKCQVFYVTLKLDINKANTETSLGIGENCQGQIFGECIEDNYDIENDDNGGIYHHDKTCDYEGMENCDLEAGDNSYRYAGKDPNNYICFGTDDTTKCPDNNLYRIIGIFNGQVKIIKVNGNKSANNGLTTNENILKGYESKWQNMVVNKEWYTSGISKDVLEKDAIGTYTLETAQSTNKSKTGLMYLNEYMYGALPKNWNLPGNRYDEATNDNWLYKGLEWTLGKVLNESNNYAIGETGKIGYNPQSKSDEARLSLYLKETVILKSGKGTKEEPYYVTDTGIVIKSLTKNNDEYRELTGQAEAESLEGNVLRYDFQIYKDGKWSDWQSSTDGTFSFDGLNPDTEYEIKVRALNNRGNYSEEYEDKFRTKYTFPTITVTGTTSDGNVPDDSWTNKDLTVNSTTSDGVGSFTTEYCRTTGTSCTPNSSGDSLKDTTEGEETVCFWSRHNGTGTTSAKKCFKSKIDKQVPSCTLTATDEEGITFASTTDQGGSGIAQTGINKSTIPNYGTTSLNLSTGTIYGHVLDNAGNYGSCNRDIIDTTKTYNKTTQTCKRGSVSSYTCKKIASSRYNCNCSGLDSGHNAHNFYENDTSYSSCTALCIAKGASDNPTGTCTFYRYYCSSGSNGKDGYCYKYGQSSCGSGWTKYPKYNYNFSSSTSSTSSCSTGSSFNCNESNENKSYVSGCSVVSTSCNQGTKLNDDYCLV